MKLIIAIINNDDAQAVLSELMRNDFPVTRLSTSGAFLRSGNVTLLMGVDNERVSEAIEVISHFSSKRKQIAPPSSAYFGESFASASPVEITVGGATVFVLDVEQFYKL